ncbi:GST-like protein [Sphingorhabdus lutea]|uniref:GST-like protein n=1 Tax=Sphingorhabdus lutea TaxID=1913578 RepID=A0A1L3JAJ8_9SPHN|nr:MAPEG family protein [Sphingorhabdus lutea]APG62152.1 GST-like protein [Sphingorhabdus lutea]
MQLPILLTIGAGAALINIWLMVRCGQARGKASVSVGDGGDDLLTRRMRAHANFIESAPIVLILLGAMEMAFGTNNWLWATGIIFIIGRLAHPLGMEGAMKLRMIGTVISMLTLLGLAIAALLKVYGII